MLLNRNKAFEVRSHSYMGQVRFLTNKLPIPPLFSRVLKRIRSDATFPGAGCCLGQGTRYLIQDGVHSTPLYGLELSLH